MPKQGSQAWKNLSDCRLGWMWFFTILRLADGRCYSPATTTGLFGDCSVIVVYAIRILWILRTDSRVGVKQTILQHAAANASSQ